MSKATADRVEVESIPVEIADTELVLVGDSPLIVHRFEEKAKKAILAKNTKQAKQAKEAKDPVAEFLGAFHVVSGTPKAGEENGQIIANSATFGFPTVGFKAAAVGACRFIEGWEKRFTYAKGAFHILGDLATIEHKSKPWMREDMVRFGMSSTDVRFRPQFDDWKVRLQIRWNYRALSLAELVNMFNLGGFGVGVGEWRPEKKGGGSFGMFHVEGDGA